MIIFLMLSFIFLLVLWVLFICWLEKYIGEDNTEEQKRGSFCDLDFF